MEVDPPPASSSSTGWCTARADRSARVGRIDRRDRRVGPHPAGVRPEVAVEDPLVVLGRGERQRGLAVAQGEQRELLSVEELLDDDLLGPEPPLDEQRVQRLARRGSSEAMITPLPAANPSALITVG